MNYNFFLFTKLNDVIFPSNQEYDLQFRYLEILFKEWEQWDLEHGNQIGTYESIEKFLTRHNP